MPDTQTLPDTRPDEFEFSLILEMVLSVTREVHLLKMRERNPDLFSYVQGKLDSISIKEIGEK